MRHKKPKTMLPEDHGAHNINEAMVNAAKISKAYPGFWYLIESGDKFFVQDTCQLQAWETLHKTYIGGRVI